MSDDERSAVPSHYTKVQFYRGEYAIQLPGHDQLRYRLNSDGSMVITRAAAGVELLPRNRLQSTMNDVINPYPSIDVLSFVNSNGDHELMPMRDDTHRVIRLAAENNNVGSGGIQINPLTGDLDARRSDGMHRVSRGTYAVTDVEEAFRYEISAPPPPTTSRTSGRSGRGGND